MKRKYCTDHSQAEQLNEVAFDWSTPRCLTRVLTECLMWHVGSSLWVGHRKHPRAPQFSRCAKTFECIQTEMDMLISRTVLNFTVIKLAVNLPIRGVNGKKISVSQLNCHGMVFQEAELKWAPVHADHFLGSVVVRNKTCKNVRAAELGQGQSCTLKWWPQRRHQVPRGSSEHVSNVLCGGKGG